MMSKKWALFGWLLVIAIVCTVALPKGGFKAIAATLVDLTRDVKNTLPHGNGGTDVTSPGTSGNVLESNGTNWTSAALGAGSVSGAVTNPKIRRWAYCGGPANLNINGNQCPGDPTSEASANGTDDAYALNTSIALPVALFGATGATAASGIVSTHNYWGTGQNLYFALDGGTRNVSTAVITRIRLGFGQWTSVAGVVSADTQASANLASFRFNPSIDTHFICESSDGTTESTADSGITPAVDTLYLFEIKFNDSVPNIVYSINGSVVCTKTTNLPAAHQALRHGFAVVQASSTIPNIFTGWIYGEADQ